MEIVTGDRYLDMLARFVEENVAALLDGSTVLKLNPLGLHYLQARLESLLELERLHTAAPVDYLRAYVADLGDHRALELLRRVLRLLGVVKVVSVLQFPARDPTPINLQPFQHLRFLELRGCDLSTSAARGLLQLRPHLEKLICLNSTDALRHVFAERMVEIQSSQSWSRLVSVSCACNAIPVMDESLQLLPAVEVLDLRRNKLTYVSNLAKCNRLQFLDLGFNWIQSVSRLEQVASSLTVLILRFNALTTTRGIETLYLLSSLDLSYNIISNFHELERLGGLRFLTSFSLQGNPVTYARNYRERTFSFFPDPVKLCLDGKYMSRIENWRLEKLIVRRSRQDGGFGTYAPAFKLSYPEKSNEVEQEEIVIKAKKKSPRLAVISDDESLKRSAATDTATDDSGVSNNAEEVEARFQHLMKRVEMLKKDKSKLWLAEMSHLFEIDAETGQEQSLQSLADRRPKSKPSRKSSKKREGSGSFSTETTPGRSMVEVNPIDIINSNPVLNHLIETPASSSSPSSPPQFNRDVFRRRQNLEEELLQVRTDFAQVSDSDSSTTTSDAESENLTTVVVLDASENITSREAGTSNPLLVGDESCFSNPMWVGSALESENKERKEESVEVEEAAATTNGLLDKPLQKTSRQQKIKKSRQAWRVVPLDYDGEGSDEELKRSTTDGSEKNFGISDCGSS